MMKFPRWFLIFIIFGINSVFAQEAYEAHTHIQLVSEQNAMVPGRTCWVGVDLKMDDGWHLYSPQAKNFSAAAPRIKWQLPPGITAGDIQWPNPERLNLGSESTLGYGHELLLLVPLSVAGDFKSSQPVNIAAHLGWVACQEVCMPGRADVAMSLPMVSTIDEVTFNGFKERFNQARQHLSETIPLWLICTFALIGGLILNLMPCVLPVLSIKVLHLVERHPDRKIAFSHSMAYALGILVSVWSLGLLLAILKAAGQFAGWGFQFQSPIFVMMVAVILFVLALNLFGVFEFVMPSIGGLPRDQAGYQASFISGVITTIVASPCTAPFMGTALTVAISQPNIVGFGIFTALGLGLAVPFVLLSAFPSLLSFVPKPGAWMVHLKQALGVVLLACVIWMLWVFGIETGMGDLLKFFKPSHEIEWQDYSAMAVSQARQSGDGVFLDFTAAWCINCQVNDRLVLQNSDVVHAFKDKGIMAFKADWTKYDPAITMALTSLGRDSIPVYVYYPPGSDAPEILPQIITPKLIVERVSGKNN